ncbi:STAS domain-containing protein [uncultured Tenacibaculum sp.]|uniref:STAS domain-containing protein n=1 Tax=uncultured Tenacibaculum sp. TaxID=174713 RepID=UPI00261552CB|nr:STAS domain-containing protein [uncultured Tenacibaculum sp.]
MALQILEKKGIFYLNGRINCSTVRSFIIHFEHYISQSKSITINIDKVKEIDTAGLDAIKTLMAMALKKRKKFSTIGYGCKDIYDHFDKVGVA